MILDNKIIKAHGKLYINLPNFHYSPFKICIIFYHYYHYCYKKKTWEKERNVFNIFIESVKKASTYLNISLKLGLSKYDLMLMGTGEINFTFQVSRNINKTATEEKEFYTYNLNILQFLNFA